MINKFSTEEMIDEVFSDNDHSDDYDGKLTLTLMCGGIGSGKSTLTNKLSYLQNAVIINKDSLLESITGRYGRYDSDKVDFYDDMEFSLIHSALKRNHCVIVDRLNTTKEQRKKFIDIAKQYSAKIIAYDYGKGSDETLKRRQSNSRGVPNSVWEAVHKRTLETYETPTESEGIYKVYSPPKSDSYKFYCWDFDGTIVTETFPGIGNIKSESVEMMRKQYKSVNNIIIIWTCRGGDHLNQARKFLMDNNIPFDYINENPLCGFECSNKVFAHKYYDDRAVNVKDI